MTANLKGWAMYISCKYSGTFEHMWSITLTTVNISGNNAWSIKCMLYCARKFHFKHLALMTFHM